MRAPVVGPAGRTVTREPTPRRDGGPSACTEEGCDADPDFWLYHPEEGRWRRLCDRHLLEVHPSIEVDAWLESGYVRPFELGEPDGPPGSPPDGRPAAFREVVDRAMDWE